MFPHELATGVCSLNPHVDRLVQSCLMEVDGRGRVVRYEMHDGVIHSAARMTYTEVNAIVTDRDAGACAPRYAPLVPMFELMRELFGVLNERRRRRGVDRLRPARGRSGARTTRAPIDGHRRLRAQRRPPHDRGVHAAGQRDRGRRTWCAHDVPALHRVHEAPDAEEGGGVRGVHRAARLQPGRDAGRRVRPPHFQQLVDRMRGTPEERPIAVLMLRTMQKARYDAASLGHFGLAAEHYTHFTSPIRRYPDLVVHRMLRESRRGALSAGAARGARGRAARGRAPHLGDGAARRRGRARAAAVEEGALHGRQGRRRVRRATSPASRPSACSSS